MRIDPSFNIYGITYYLNAIFENLRQIIENAATSYNTCTSWRETDGDTELNRCVCRTARCTALAHPHLREGNTCDIFYASFADRHREKPWMRTLGEHTESWLAELSDIEFESQRMLDDESLKLIAELRSRKLLTNEEWNQIKLFLRKALEFLSGQPKILRQAAHGSTVIDPDLDPRNADWLRISAACRLAGHDLPMWAALWLWWLRTDTSPRFWNAVGRVAEQLGWPRKPSIPYSGSPSLEVPQNIPGSENEVIIQVGTELGSIELEGIRTHPGWRFCASSRDQSAMILSNEDRGDLPLESQNGLIRGKRRSHYLISILGRECILWLSIQNSEPKYGSQYKTG
jgi:hypothetical protein